jgi:hypothetical protein
MVQYLLLAGIMFADWMVSTHCGEELFLLLPEIIFLLDNWIVTQ